MRVDCACLSLPRFAIFLLGFPEAVVSQGAHYASRLPGSNKIKFSYLNWNLMVPKLHPLTLTFDNNPREMDNVSSFDLRAAVMAW